MSQLKFIAKKRIHEGWSGDEKYCATAADGTNYFLRIVPEAKSAQWEETFRLQQKAAALGVPMCKPLAIDKVDKDIHVVQTWSHQQDDRAVVPHLADSAQYALGLEAGRILKQIHKIEPPENQPNWEERFNAKIDRTIKRYQQCPIQFEGADKIMDYIHENRYLLADRPQVFQHGDYHIGNMMMEQGKIVVIDFDRYDFGDPWEEFNRIVWSAQVAPIFASGIINGYFNDEVPFTFWKLLALYISHNTLSSIPWAVPFGEQEIQTMLNQAKDVLAWYDDMKNPVPAWYSKGYYLQYLDGIPFKLKAPFNFDFIKQYGTVFKVFDDQDSGNICFGTQKDGERFFVKFAGAPTEAYNGTPEEAIEI